MNAVADLEVLGFLPDVQKALADKAGARPRMKRFLLLAVMIGLHVSYPAG